MDEVRWLDSEEQRAWRAYLDSTRLLIQALDRQLEADSGVSMLDYEVLVVLSEAPDRRMRMRDLADAVLSTRSGATRAVTRLERLGWVRRTDCADDRRGTEAELTEEGLAKLAATAPGHVAAVRAHMFDLLTPREVEHLRTVGTKIRDHLQHPAS
ncbi:MULTISPECIES: MarR family winged helix-turn-helix transcriptional regulator [Microtetraspora]|uniref:MarR family transcriptional regulator n=1 Tax=Microtetraspora glauca TaxID=1996 RepID=A0ABV3GQ71_MICGL|nr:MarR family transcriptional regulator [Microtetraspora sp. AC03309]MCC5578777.1 MarR family transcriptional regulator [Microtetraspora sp. AC03309]